MAHATGTARNDRRVPPHVHGHDPGRASASRIRAAGGVLLVAYLLTVGWLILRPQTVPWVAPSNLQPLATIRADLAAGPRAAVKGIGGDLLLLAPVGVLLPLAAGRLRSPRVATAARTVLTGLLLALGVSVLRSGAPGQVVTLDAVLLNVTGIALAHLLVYPPLRRRLLRPPRRRRARTRVELREEGTQGRTPRRSRVGFTP